MAAHAWHLDVSATVAGLKNLFQPLIFFLSLTFYLPPSTMRRWRFPTLNCFHNCLRRYTICCCTIMAENSFEDEHRDRDRQDGCTCDRRQRGSGSCHGLHRCRSLRTHGSSPRSRRDWSLSLRIAGTFSQNLIVVVALMGHGVNFMTPYRRPR